MTSKDILRRILAENPKLTEGEVLERLTAERHRTGDLLSDETLLRLIAAKHGVSVEQNGICNSGILSTSRLFSGLNDVTVAGRVLAVFPARSFEGEKPGKYAALILADNEGTLRVMLWNDNAELVEKGELKVGQTARFLHGYTREDRFGKVELHLGSKSKVELDWKNSETYPGIEKFNVKIASLTVSSGVVYVSCQVKEIFESKTFTRSDSSEGSIMRFTLADDTGTVMAVAWNDRAIELQKNLKPGAKLRLVNAKVREAQNGALEVHIDQNTYTEIENTAPSS